ncbi:MAG TPA: flavin-dependent oxidoreductase [Acetobacteraceae bacterium]|nr:flavin-dependent oxidoreductase [Acetobacteraceae bacterium]
MEVVIAGGGIGGLTLALALHAHGIPSRVFEAAPEIRPLGVGVNLLPHATAALDRLGLLPALEAVAVTTYEASYFNRFGQLILSEPLGRRAGYDHPQLSIHRADLHAVLLEAARTRIGAERITLGARCISVDETRGIARFVDSRSGAALPDAQGTAIIACDGFHSAVRAQFFPDEGPPIYSGVNMWRGVTRMAPILSGATMVRAGWLAQGKMVIYPIRRYEDGTVLMNWVAEIETPHYLANDWARPGGLDDFLPAFADWRFDWCDVPAMIQGAEIVLEYPMVDRDPLPRWSHGRVTLLGDAAHPMYPRGSNGAGQAILDAVALADCLSATHDPVEALADYERRRLGPTSAVVRTSRTAPPDVVIKTVWERTGDKPFRRIEDVIPPEELMALVDRYKQVAGYSKAAIKP